MSSIIKRLLGETAMCSALGTGVSIPLGAISAVPDDRKRRRGSLIRRLSGLDQKKNT
jgi:hypothetical protein